MHPESTLVLVNRGDAECNAKRIELQLRPSTCCVAAEGIEHFTSRYVTGADLPAGSPVLTLRDYVVAGCDSEPARVIALKTLRCALADMKGERIEKLFSKEDALDHFRKLHQTLDATPAAAA